MDQHITERDFPITQNKVSGLILAGGRGQRMGGEDKGLLKWRGMSLIEHVIQRLRGQVETLLISANRNITIYEKFGYPVVPDAAGGYAGPMAGILSGLKKMKSDWLVVCPCDAPLLPEDFVQRLIDVTNKEHQPLCITITEDRLQPVHLLLHRSLTHKLEVATQAGHLKMQQWLQAQAHSLCHFSDTDAFRNINTPDELE